MRPSLLTWFCTPLSAGLPRWSSLALVPLNLATALLSAQGLHRYVLDLVASPHLGHLCFSWHVWGRGSFLLLNLDLYQELRHVEEFPGCPHFIWDISCVELERQILWLFAL